MKTKEELNALKEEVETMNRKLAELSEEEITEVTGGIRRRVRIGGGELQSDKVVIVDPKP